MFGRKVIGFPIKPKRRPWKVYYHILPNVDYFFYVPNANTTVVTWYDERKHKISKSQVSKRNGIVTSPSNAEYATVKGKCISASIAWKGTQEEGYEPYKGIQDSPNEDMELWHFENGKVTEIVRLPYKGGTK